MMIYDRVKYLAKKRNVSIRKIEIDCGFSQGSVCKWNEVSPSAEKVKKVADYLKTSVDEILKSD